MSDPYNYDADEEPEDDERCDFCDMYVDDCVCDPEDADGE